MWNPVPWPGIEPWLPALVAWSLSIWTTREVPDLILIALSLSSGHCGLLVSQNCQGHSHLRTFALAILFTRKCLPSNIHFSLPASSCPLCKGDLLRWASLAALRRRHCLPPAVTLLPSTLCRHAVSFAPSACKQEHCFINCCIPRT